MLAAEGKVGGKPIVGAETLRGMTTPQLTADASGFGLGFMVGKLHDHKTVSHSGAVYGHSSALVFLPESKIGVVMLSNDDFVGGPIGKLANRAAELMLRAKLGEEPPSAPAIVPFSGDALPALVGEYESATTWARIEAEEGRLAGRIGGRSVSFVPIGELEFLVEGRCADGSPAVFERNGAARVVGFTALKQKFERLDPAAIEEPCPQWEQYVGSYGPDFMPLVISVRHGHLYAMTENATDYRLTPINRRVFAFPPGMYADEHLVILDGPDGNIWGVDLANMVLPRRTAQSPSEFTP